MHVGGRDPWRGCQAGRYVLGIELNGAVKGCPSLQTAHYSCHYRAKTRAAEGTRERLVPKAPAPGRPFNHGLDEIVEEPFDAPDPKPELQREYVKTKRWPKPA